MVTHQWFLLKNLCSSSLIVSTISSLRVISFNIFVISDVWSHVSAKHITLYCSICFKLRKNKLNVLIWQICDKPTVNKFIIEYWLLKKDLKKMIRGCLWPQLGIPFLKRSFYSLLDSVFAPVFYVLLHHNKFRQLLNKNLLA